MSVVRAHMPDLVPALDRPAVRPTRPAGGGSLPDTRTSARVGPPAPRWRARPALGVPVGGRVFASGGGGVQAAGSADGSRDPREPGKRYSFGGAVVPWAQAWKKPVRSLPETFWASASNWGQDALP